MMLLVTFIAGLASTFLVKKIAVTACRRVMHRGMFRVRPRASNAASIALEVWYFSIGSGAFLARFVQIAIAVLFWIGRIDVPMLDANVHLGPLDLDGFSTHFVKDLLIHDAHRHPYMERLAQVYLLQWRHNFANQAASAWRHVLVQTLFPWMRKYRVHSGVRIYQALKSKSNGSGDSVDNNQDQLVVAPVAWIHESVVMDL